MERAKKITDYAKQEMVPYWVALIQIIHGWALVQQGRIEPGIEEQKQGLSAWKSMGAGMGLTLYLLLLSESFQVNGLFDEGLNTVAEALAIVQSGQEGLVEAELYRRQGELILAKGRDELKAESCFQRALETARRQHARSYELRAATSLSRLWQKQGKYTDAYQILADVYNWFSEGFATPDLEQAREQLKSLA
jgi:adenylate cyclase